MEPTQDDKTTPLNKEESAEQFAQGPPSDTIDKMLEVAQPAAQLCDPLAETPLAKKEKKPRAARSGEKKAKKTPGQMLAKIRSLSNQYQKLMSKQKQLALFSKKMKTSKTAGKKAIVIKPKANNKPPKAKQSFLTLKKAKQQKEHGKKKTDLLLKKTQQKELKQKEKNKKMFQHIYQAMLKNDQKGVIRAVEQVKKIVNN